MTRFDAAELRRFAQDALAACGLAPDRAAVVGDVLVEGDLLGHTTHGLALLSPYAEALLGGGMAATGDPVVISDRGAAIAWDGMRLPGPWLVQQGIALASARAAQYGTATLAIRRSHHIACLAAYLEPTARAGKMLLVLSSDPGVAAVAPFGGKTAVFTPNPIAAGWPTQGEPVLLDISTSLTTVGMVGRQHRAGAPLPHPWLVDSEGRASADPAVVMGGGGALLPLGGLEAGHKGFGLGLMVEALTSALGGGGRSGTPDGWGASVMIQVIDPAAFGGGAAFAAETQAVADACRAATPIDAGQKVRMPGAAALARKARQLAEGVELHEGIAPALSALAGKLGLVMPAA
jgi:LDH2 family malate/lactate/ureidoglycolate dehydrogenase